ncbi:hypothetical protein K9M06_02175 [Candidatus Bipolaricaulota bacterium]|nr:hypothetical protein [Candidatus Bipolaricaulota bacterium]
MNPRENLIQALNRREPEWLPAPFVDRSMSVVTHEIREYPPGGGVDDWGVEWKQGEEEIGAGVPVKHPIKKPSDIDSCPFPNPNEEGLMDSALDQIERIDRSTSMVFGDNGWGLFERAWILVGMDRLLIWMYKEPEAVEKLLTRIARVKIKITERLIEEVDVDGIGYGDDWGGETALIMGPKLWRKFLKPQQQKLYDVCIENDVPIMQHSDGHIEEIIPDLIEMGLTMLDPLQPEANDVEKIKEKFGDKLAFHGAVGSRILHHGNPDEVRTEVKTRINQLSKGGGYVIAPAHSHSYPEENLRAFRDSAIEHGSIPEKWIRNSFVEMAGDTVV